MKQTRFQEDIPSVQPARPARRSSMSQPRTQENMRRWDEVNPPRAPQIEVNSSMYGPNFHRPPRTYHSHSRHSNYTTKPPSRGEGVHEGALLYNNDGIRVYAQPEPLQSQLPSRETYTSGPAYVPRHIPQPVSDSYPPRVAPIGIPNNAPGPPPIHTTFHATPPPPVTSPSNLTYPYGISPQGYPVPEPPVKAFEGLGLGSESHSPRETLFTQSTNASGDKGSGSWRRRRNSYKEEGFYFPAISARTETRESGEVPGRAQPTPRHQRRRSASGQMYLNPSPRSSEHSRSHSEESVFPPAEDMPKRRGSLWERDHNTDYWKQQLSGQQGNFDTHQTSYEQAAQMGNIWEGGRRESRAESPATDVWIAVMGVTGSGKSTFIQTATGDRSVGVNHGLRSCTGDVVVHSFRIDGFTVNLIDTPGFDDNKRSETEVLQTISAYLAKAYYNKIFLNGIIYMHSIVQTRMGGSGVRGLGILERLVGKDNMGNVLLVSNMWDALKHTVNLDDGRQYTGQEVGEMRERELSSSDEFWKRLIDLGAHTSRHRGDSRYSALKLIRRFLSPTSHSIGRPMKLLLQYELVDKHMRLEETEVGQYINAKLYEGQQILEKEFEDLKRKHKRAPESHALDRSNPRNELEILLDHTKKGLSNMRRKAEILGKRVDELVDEQGDKVTPHIGRTSGTHAGLCSVM